MPSMSPSSLSPRCWERRPMGEGHSRIFRKDQRMSQGRDVRQVGDRIEAVLGEMRATADPRLIGQAEELVRLLMEFYGAGLERAIEVVWADGEDQAALDRMVDDELVASLMLLHGLHPLSSRNESRMPSTKYGPTWGRTPAGWSTWGWMTRVSSTFSCREAAKAARPQRSPSNSRSSGRFWRRRQRLSGSRFRGSLIVRLPRFCQPARLR